MDEYNIVSTHLRNVQMLVKLAIAPNKMNNIEHVQGHELIYYNCVM